VSYLGLINSLYLITLIVMSSPVHPPQHLAPEQGPLCVPKTSGDGIRLEVEEGDQRQRSQPKAAAAPAASVQSADVWKHILEQLSVTIVRRVIHGFCVSVMSVENSGGVE